MGLGRDYDEGFFIRKIAIRSQPKCLVSLALSHLSRGIGRRSGLEVYAEGSPRPRNVICMEKFDPLRLSKIARVLTEIC